MHSGSSNAADDTLSWSHSLPVTHSPTQSFLSRKVITFQNTERVAKLESWQINHTLRAFQGDLKQTLNTHKSRICITNKSQVKREVWSKQGKKYLGEWNNSFYLFSLHKL